MRRFIRQAISFFFDVLNMHRFIEGASADCRPWPLLLLCLLRIVLGEVSPLLRLCF